MDSLIRTAAFIWLEEQTHMHGDVLPWEILQKGFDFQGQRIIPIGATGIWKPKIMELPLSITTSFGGPYKDTFTHNNYLSYKYRGTDPYQADNVRLRQVMKDQKPLIYFLSVAMGRYMATWPVYIVGDNMKELTFTVAVDDLDYVKKVGVSENLEDPGAEYRRAYITSNVLVRLHQRSFRERVLQAYRNQCALCRLRHIELLDAAHIIGDKNETGDPVIQNGLSLCKIHHAAFDKNIIGINPDYQIKVRQDILEETDGPMLKYGIQFLENNKLILPRHKEHWPDRERLNRRFIEFTKAG
jgi:putative restriction endonuclease